MNSTPSTQSAKAGDGVIETHYPHWPPQISEKYAK